MNPGRARGVALGLVGAGVVLALTALAFAHRGERQAGAALYEGRQPLVAQLRGQAWALPAEASRCINCHEGAQAIGPRLHGRSLAEPLPRRGGPPSRYDAKALCRLLREGVDPAQVLVPQAMPRYTIDDRSCEALWRYLSSR